MCIRDRGVDTAENAVGRAPDRSAHPGSNEQQREQNLMHRKSLRLPRLGLVIGVDEVEDLFGAPLEAEVPHRPLELAEGELAAVVRVKDEEGAPHAAEFIVAPAAESDQDLACDWPAVLLSIRQALTLASQQPTNPDFEKFRSSS